MRLVALVALAVAVAAPAHADPVHGPNVHVALDAPELDAAARDRHIGAMRDALAVAAPHARQLDVSIGQLEVAQSGAFVDVCEHVRVVVSDGRGRMTAIVSVVSTVRVARRGFRASALDALRAEALADAARKVASTLRERARATS